MKKRSVICMVIACTVLVLAAYAASHIPADRGYIARRYIAELGWTCAKGADEVKKLTIPQEFDEVYTRYNDLQRQAGFDLTPYRGREVTRYTYRVTDGGQDNVFIHILMYDSKIIGGDIMSTGLDGFMLPLAEKEFTDGTTG